jgi:caspase domain-containing protein/lysozyme inhibitor LprI
MGFSMAIWQSGWALYAYGRSGTVPGRGQGHGEHQEDGGMKSAWKAQRFRVGPLLAALSVLLVTVLPGGAVLWAQTKSLTVDGKAVAGGERRLALVIGNAAYESAPLRNPVNDARAMATTLRTLGFEVAALENASLTEMKRAIDDFGDALRSKGGVGLFYFSGHGIQINGRNFIIPVGARVKGERDVEYESVDAGRILGKMEDAGNRMNLVILDACRDNPFARSFRSAASGLASLDAASGTFIAYATAPGRTADDGTGANGLYTEQLMRYMKTPGLKVEDVFKRVRIDVEKTSGGKQVPWESSSLKGDFYFSGAPGEAAIPPPPSTPGKPAGPARTIDEEEALWKVIESSTNPVDFEEYLSAFPQGRFAIAARARLRQLRRPEPPQTAERPPQRSPSAPMATTSPSFDCTKASLLTEQLICTNDALSTLDVRMASLYSSALARATDKEALKKVQRAWLKTRRDVCPDVACLQRVYQERITELSR